MSLFALQDVSCMAGGRTILHVDHLMVNEGAHIVLHGASGSGKTTLLSLMAGLRRADSGRVSFQGHNFIEIGDAAMDQMRGRSFGFVMQGFHLIRHLTVQDNIRLARYAAGFRADDQKIDTVLERLGISNLINARASTLSFGEAQRVAVARSIINDPAVIFADEPTSALDDQNALDVVTLLKQQANITGAALVVATHDSRVAGYFQHTIKLQNGQVAS